MNITQLLFRNNAKRMPLIAPINGDVKINLNDTDKILLVSFLQHANKPRVSLATNMPAQRWICEGVAGVEQKQQELNKIYKNIDIIEACTSVDKIATYNEVISAFTDYPKSFSQYKLLQSYFMFFVKLCETTYNAAVLRSLQSDVSGVILDIYAKLYSRAQSRPFELCIDILEKNIEVLTLLNSVQKNMRVVETLQLLVDIIALKLVNNTYGKVAFIDVTNTTVISDFRSCGA